MAISKFEKYVGGSRDEDGYLILHESALCVRCHKPIAMQTIKDVEKRRIIQILGYCGKCFTAIMGW